MQTGKGGQRGWVRRPGSCENELETTNSIYAQRVSVQYVLDKIGIRYYKNENFDRSWLKAKPVTASPILTQNPCKKKGIPFYRKYTVRPPSWSVTPWPFSTTSSPVPALRGTPWAGFWFRRMYFLSLILENSQEFPPTIQKYVVLSGSAGVRARWNDPPHSDRATTIAGRPYSFFLSLLARDYFKGNFLRIKNIGKQQENRRWAARNIWEEFSKEKPLAGGNHRRDMRDIFQPR